MNRALWILIGSAAALFGLLWLVPSNTSAPISGTNGKTGSAAAVEPIVVFCAASNRAVFEAIRKDYEAEYRVPVTVQYGPSETLLSSFQVSGTGDLYLPADESYLDIARKKGVVDEVLPLAQMHAVLAMPRSASPPESLEALLQSNAKIVQASDEATAIGKLTRQALTTSGRWEALAARTSAFKTTVNEVANDVQVGAADAGIVFDAVLATYPELKAVSVPELADITADVSIGVIASTKQPQRALHFARYLAADDRGLKRYIEFGFRPVIGDPWEERPELTLYAGSMLRPAIEESIIEFEKREGVQVTRVYNGCGILVAQMKSGKVPDAYFACDSEFMQQVQDLFPVSADVSQNQLVILVPKGNPKGLRSLKDLTMPGLRVGIGHEKQCAMGWLTQKTLKEGGVQTEVMANVTVQTPTGDMLVNQMKAGSLDAAVAYISNAAGSGDVLDAIRITNIPCATATQPFGIAQSTPHRHLAMRLQERLQAAESRTIFEQQGFLWKEAATAPGK
jgi:molybdenum ABC transporter molybdate-binding protein